MKIEKREITHKEFTLHLSEAEMHFLNFISSIRTEFSPVFEEAKRRLYKQLGGDDNSCGGSWRNCFIE